MDFHIALIVCTVVYGIVGGVVLLLSYNSIIVQNRKPRLLIFEQINIFITGFCSVGILHPVISKNVCCEVYQAVASITGLNALLTLTARMSFVYNYLMDKTAFKYHGLNRFAGFFWDKNNCLKKMNLFALIGLGDAIIISELIVYDLTTSKYGWCIPLNRCSGKSILFITYFNYCVIALLVAYSFQFIRFRIMDQICMSIEVTLFTFSLILSVVVCILIFGYFNSYAVHWQTLAGMFFGMYFPGILSWTHKLKMKKKTSKSYLLSRQVTELCKRFFCEENSLFLEMFAKYENKMVTSLTIETLFIIDNAQYELNISYDLKNSVLNASEEFKQEKLRIVYSEIATLIQLNILPYIDNIEQE